MRILNTLFLFIVFVIAFVCIGLFCVSKGYCDIYIKNALMRFLSYKSHQYTNSIKYEINDLKIKNHVLLIPHVEITDANGTKLTLNDLEVVFDIVAHNKWFVLETKLKISDVTVNNSAFKPSSLVCRHSYKPMHKQDLSCDFFSSDNSIHFTSKSVSSFLSKKSVQIKMDLVNIPLEIYTLGSTFLSKETNNIFTQYIKAGLIKKGLFALNLDDQFFKSGVFTAQNLEADFDLTNLDIQYHPAFKSITNVDGKMTVRGNEIKFLIAKGNMGNTPINSGEVGMLWQGLDKTILQIKTSSTGPVSDLISFCDKDAIANAQKSGINLANATGVAKTQASIQIPLSMDVKNTYDVSSDISNASLNLFDGKIIANKMTLKGSFDGHAVTLEGTGYLNQNQSNISYVYNLSPILQANYTQSLKLKMRMISPKQMIHDLYLGQGNALLDLEYKNTNDNHLIKATANLRDLEFNFAKLGINKSEGSFAKLDAKATLKNIHEGQINFKIYGDNINVVGDVLFKPQSAILNMPIINSNSTNLSANINLGVNSSNIKIYGRVLDLSDADMMTFVKKGSFSDTDNKLMLDIDDIILKDGIILKNVKLNTSCDKIRCYAGSLNAKVGSKVLTMSLSASADEEEWNIDSTNAGAVLRGIGIYPSMKNGKMNLKINTKRHYVQNGSVIPILKGEYTVQNFMISNNQFITKLVSIISLPGFIGLLTNNKDIPFSTMKSKFSYDTESVSIQELFAEGPYFDLTMKGKVDFYDRVINVKGSVTPALYGINKMIKVIPIVGTILSGGHRKGLVSAPYKIQQKF